MKRILFYLSGIYNGGTEIETLNLIKELDHTKYDILYYYEDKQNSDNNIVSLYNKYAKYIDLREKSVIDTIIYSTSALESVDILKHVRFNKAYFWFHYFWEDQEKFLKQCIEKNWINKVIAVSEYTKNKLLQLEFMKEKEDKIKVIYNLLPIKEIKKKAEDNIKFEKAQTLNLVTVARFAPIKGYIRVKQMIDILLKENIDFKWYIIGKGSNAKEHNEVVNILKNYGDRVKLTGYLENPYPYIKKSDYLVLMSDRETSGLVITEAKIVGTPCITSDFDSVYEQIEDEKDGFIIRKDNISEFKDKLPIIIKSKERLKNNLKTFSYDTSKIIKEWDRLLNN